MEKIQEVLEIMKIMEKDSEFPTDVRIAALQAQIALMKVILLLSK